MARHTICHVEWACTDLQRAKTFYGGLFDWSFTPWGEEYLMFRTPDQGIGGALMSVPRVQAGNSPLVYVLVDTIEPYLDQAKKLGGGVAVPKTEIPTIGWFAHLTDPDGNTLGIFQPLPGQ
jgi:predicted enzyme related to lactoylglutathione lyase